MNTCYKATEYPFLKLEAKAIKEDFDQSDKEAVEKFEELNDFMIGYKFNRMKSHILIYPQKNRGGVSQVNIGDYLVITAKGIERFSESEFEDTFFLGEEEQVENQD